MNETVLPLSEVKSTLSELGRRVHDQHERVVVTRNGEAHFVMVSLDDLEGLEISVETLADADSVARIAASLRGLAAGEPGSTPGDLRADLAARRTGG